MLLEQAVDGFEAQRLGERLDVQSQLPNLVPGNEVEIDREHPLSCTARRQRCFFSAGLIIGTETISVAGSTGPRILPALAPRTCSNGNDLGIGAAGQEGGIDAVYWVRLDGRFGTE